VITVRNCPRYLSEALLSVLNQSLKPKEVILVDDASTDETPDLLRKLEGRFPIKVVRNEENLERCQSRNRGAAVASADWVCFLDCDDLWDRDHLLSVKETAEALPGAKAFYAPPKGLIDAFGRLLKEKRPPKEDFDRLLFAGRVGYPSGSCFERETFLRLGGYLDRYLMREDWEIFLRYRLAGLRVAFLPRGEYFVREHGSRTSRSRRFLRATLRVYNDYKRALSEDRRSLTLLHAAAQCLRFGRPRCGRRLFFSLLAERPELIKERREVWEVLKRLIGRRRR